MTSLYQISEDYNNLLNRLFNEDEIHENSLSLLQVIEDDINHKTISIASYIKNLDAERLGIEEAIKNMKARATRLENKAEHLSNYLKDNLIKMNITEIKCSNFVVKIKECPEKVVIDGEIPKELLRIKITEDPDKAKIKEFIKNNDHCSFAHLEKDKRLEIK